MKKKILLISFMVMIVLILVACGNKAHSLNGSYTVSTMGIDTTYTFDKDGNRIHDFVTPIDCGCVFSKLFEWLEKE